MTVSELIAMLLACDPNKNVTTESASPFCNYKKDVNSVSEGEHEVHIS